MKIEINLTSDESDEEFIEHLKTWKKEISPTDVAKAWSKVKPDDIPEEVEIMFDFLIAKTIAEIWPREEYEDLFEKGEA